MSRMLARLYWFPPVRRARGWLRAKRLDAAVASAIWDAAVEATEYRLRRTTGVP